MSPRMAWRAIQDALPREAIISSDIGNNCAIGNAYPSFDAGGSILLRGYLAHAGMGFRQFWARKLAVRMCLLLALLGMELLAFL